MLGTYHRLGLHVSASPVDVIRAARKRIAKHHRRDPAKREERKRFYRIMLAHHSDARELMRQFRLSPGKGN